MLTARNAMLSFAMWLGVLQSVLPPQYNGPSGAGLGSIAQEAGLAVVLASLTILVYKLGVWRQVWENTKDNLEAEVKALRDELAGYFKAVEHVSTIEAEARARTARWQSRIERRLARLEAVEVDAGGAE
jgi:hypothetical protein